jgi:hypothetical protein
MWRRGLKQTRSGRPSEVGMMLILLGSVVVYGAAMWLLFSAVHSSTH